MKFNVNREELAGKLASVSRAVANRSSLPILGNILVLADENGVFLKATNLEFGVVAKLNRSEVDELGSTTVPAKRFGEVVAALTGDDVDVSTDERSLTLKCGKQRNKFSTLPSDDFPIIGTGGKVLASFTNGLFSQLTKSVQSCFADDQARPALSGIRVVSNGETIKFEAADGFRLGQHQVEFKSDDFDLLVPGGSLIETMRFAGDDVVVRKEKNSIVLDFGDIVAVLQEIDARFPDTSNIVPKVAEDSFVITLNKSEFLSAIKAADVFAKDAAHTIRMQCSSEGITLKGISVESGENETEVSVTELKNGQDGFEIAYNATYMRDAVDSLHGNTANVLMTSKTSPLLVFGDNANHKHTIMPLHLGR